jgi:DNA invertase Pin-like site-specific DNA recombinase
MTRRRRAPGNPLVAVHYIRESTADQHLSPEAQRAEVGRWAKVHGVAITAEFVDHGVSGGDELGDRPGLVAALQALREHRAGLLVVKDRTRLARDVSVAISIEKAVENAGAKVVSADGAGNGDGPIDKFLRRQMDLASELHRAMIKANTKAALAAKKAKGELVSRHAPYGQRLAADGIHLEPHPEEQATIARAKALRATGLSLRDLTEELEAEGRTNRRGKAFDIVSLNKMLQA